MPAGPGPFDIEKTCLILGPGGNATPKDRSDRFYEELHEDFDGFAGHVLVSRGAFTTAWSTWEMHPKGDEFFDLFSGDIDFVLWTGGAEKAVRVSEPGTYIVVPKGTWHTARPRKASVLLFVTPGEGTKHAKRPPART